MTETLTQTGLPPQFPDRTQLPEEDGTFGKNFQEHPQSLIQTDSIGPHPQGCGYSYKARLRDRAIGRSGDRN